MKIIKIIKKGGKKPELKMCKCGKNPATEPHACPYEEDMRDNKDESFCTCCSTCTKECSDAI